MKHKKENQKRKTILFRDFIGENLYESAKIIE
jgi:hypothetical protein